MKRNWNELPTEMKFEVIKYLDVRSRTRFRSCSKSTRRIVDSVPILIHSLYVKCVTGQPHSISISILEQNHDAYFSLFKKVDSEFDGIVVERYEENECIARRELETSCYIRAAIDELNSILSIPNVHFEFMHLDAGPFCDKLNLTKEIKTRTIMLIDNFHWISNICLNVDKLSLFSRFELVDEVLCDKEQMKTAKEIYMDIYGQNCDKYILDFNAERIEFRSTSVANRSINLYLKKLSATSSNIMLIFKATKDTKLDDISRDFEIAEKISEDCIILNLDGERKLKLAIDHNRPYDSIFTARMM